MATEVKQPEVIVQNPAKKKLVEQHKISGVRTVNHCDCYYGSSIVVGGYLIYHNYFKGPEEAKANEADVESRRVFQNGFFPLASEWRWQ